MNSTDSALLIGVAAVSSLITLRYGWTEEKLHLPGLDTSNTKKLIAAIAVVSWSIVIFSAVNNSKSPQIK